LTETYHVVNIGRALQGLEPVAPKNGARFHFSMPGSVQGFVVDDGPETHGILTVGNDALNGSRALTLDFSHLAPGRHARAHTATFLPPEAVDMPGYTLLASPTLYPGQVVTAQVQAAPGNTAAVNCRLFITIYGDDEALMNINGPEANLEPGQPHTFEWRIPETDGAPIARIGFELTSETRADGRVFVDWLTW